MTEPEEDYEQLFLKGVDEVSLHPESDFEDSFFHIQQQRLKREMNEAKDKARMQKSMILKELKQQATRNAGILEEFKADAQELAKITRGEQKNNVIDQEKLKDIKEKIALKIAETSGSSLKMAEEAVHKNILTQSLYNGKGSVGNAKGENSKQAKSKTAAEAEEKIKQQQERLRLKMEEMFRDRELIAMAKEDSLSLKYEEEYHSHLLADRFYKPKIQSMRLKLPPIVIDLPEPIMTYTNLAPQKNTEDNVHSRHSRVMALRALASRRSAKIDANSSIIPGKVVFSKKQLLAKEADANQMTRSEAESVQTTMPEKNSSNKNISIAQIFLEINKYFKKISPDIKKLEVASRKYQPKFAKEFLEENQKNLNLDLEDRVNSPNGKPLERFISDLDDPQALKEINITFERLRDVKGIGCLKSIEYAKLQFNLLESVEQIKQCRKLIEINLSNNSLLSFQGLEQLQFLRVLNLQKNKIMQIEKFTTSSIEFLSLTDNSIKAIEGLEELRYLRRLTLSHNMVQSISGLSELQFLDQLDLSHNKITRLQNLNQCLLLRKIDISHNKISAFAEPLILMFLNTLRLSSNSLEMLGSMLLPSLEQLYLDNNRISASHSGTVYLPNLKQLNFDDNRLENLGPVWKALLYSRQSLEFLKYDNNDPLCFSPDKVREGYQYLISFCFPSLKIVNQNEISIGTRSYLHSLYGKIFGLRASASANRDYKLGGLLSKVSWMLKQRKLMTYMQKEQPAKAHLFWKTNEFVQHKSVGVASDLLQITDFIADNRSMYFCSYKSLFHKYDRYTLQVKTALHRIESRVIQIKYRQQKRQKYYQKKRGPLATLLRHSGQVYWRCGLLFAVNKFRQNQKYRNGHSQAIKIQKTWRMYSVRKKYLAVRDQIRRRNQKREDSEFEDFDVDDINFFDQEIKLETFNLKIPEGFLFNIPAPATKYEQPAVTAPKQTIQKPNSSIEKPQKKKLELVNNFMKSTGKISNNISAASETSISTGRGKNTLPPLVSKEQEIDRIMKEFGYANRQTALAQYNAMHRNKKLKEKTKPKNSDQRLQEFKKISGRR